MTLTGAVCSWRSISLGTVRGLFSPFCLLQPGYSEDFCEYLKRSNMRKKTFSSWLTSRSFSPVSPVWFGHLLPCQCTQLPFWWVFEPEQTERNRSEMELTVLTYNCAYFAFTARILEMTLPAIAEEPACKWEMWSHLLHDASSQQADHQLNPYQRLSEQTHKKNTLLKNTQISRNLNIYYYCCYLVTTNRRIFN